MMSTTWIAFIAAMALVIVIAFPCNADSLIVRDGNIVLIHPLTSGGKDSDPLMAPDGRTGYFVRTIPDPEASLICCCLRMAELYCSYRPPGPQAEPSTLSTLLPVRFLTSAQAMRYCWFRTASIEAT